jgi:3-phosphoshikimate 1-carboxyvinyltransferase
MDIRSGGPVDGDVEAPPSKSLTIRALAAAALASGRSALRRPLFSDDTYLMAQALQSLGIRVTRRRGSVMVEGQGGRIPVHGVVLDLGHAGTPLRLLTALCSLGRGRFVLDGSPRMRQRPVADLLEALASIGVTVVSMHGDGCPPIELVASGFPGGRVRLRGAASSQYLSALLLAAPYGREDLEITVEGTLVSRPYVDLTIDTMRAFGVAVEREEHRWFRVRAGGVYQPRVHPIEGDASSASYFFAAAAITRGRVRVTGIPSDSLQGDLRLLDWLEQMGCAVRRDPAGIEVVGAPLTGIEADLTDCPDIGPTLAVIGMFAEGPTTLRGIAHLRLKESDRIEAVASCVRAMGASAETSPDMLRVQPPAAGRIGLCGTTIDPHDDHRLAMAFAVAGLAVPGVTLLNPACVRKSFPDFFDRLRSVRRSPA